MSLALSYALIVPFGTLKLFLCIGGIGAFVAGLTDRPSFLKDPPSFLNLYICVIESPRVLSGHGDF